MTVEAEMSDSDWTRAHPTRWYRIRRNGAPDGRGMIAATIVRIFEDRRSSSRRNIRIRVELSDTDDAAVQALKEYEMIVTAQMARLGGKVVGVDGAMATDTVLSTLRQGKIGIEH